MQHLIENLKDISDRIALAQEKNDYEEILKLDHHRKLIVEDIFSIGIKQLSEENKLPILVFDMNTSGNLEKVIQGDTIGTLVDN